MSIKIRYLFNSEIKKFQNFVLDNWKSNNILKKNHILSKEKNVISFYYNFKKKKKINILGIFNKKVLVGALGLIPYNNWDYKLKKDFFMAFMAKSKKYYGDITFNFLKKIYKDINPNFLAVSGFNSKIKKIYNKIGNVYSFDHYYILNPNLQPKVSQKLIAKKKKKKKIIDLKLIISNKIQKLPYCKSFPKKSKKYFINKYLNNPFYNYFVINFFHGKKLVFFFICKKIMISKLNSSIYRIIDFYGNVKKSYNINSEVSKLLIKNKIEYIDFKCFGFKKNILINLGFFKKKKNQIIPGYFEPFVKKNNELKLCIFKNNYNKNLIIVKGDGDQDRPNII